MKYLFGVLALILIVGGVFFGFRLGKNDNSANTGYSGETTVSEQSGPGVLDLSNQGITTVGPEVYNKTNTTTLILSNNSIKSLPSQMGNMTKLTVLKIDNNALEGSLIGELRKMSQLQTLDVSDNKMTGIPAEIGQLRKLQTLDYSNNDITGIPNELADLSGNLKQLDLSGNPLTQAQIAKLKTALPNTTITF